jgi:hypothetical protein
VSIGPSDAGNGKGSGTVPPPPPTAAQPVNGDPGSWTQVGPGGGMVFQVAVKPDEPDVALAAAAGGLFRTSDAGAHWQKVALPPATFPAVQSVTFSPADPARAWAGAPGDVLYTSGDGGLTWTGTSTAAAFTATDLNQIVPDPADGRTVYAATRAGLFVSRDAGRTWTAFWVRTPPQGETSAVCALAFGAPSTLFSGPCNDTYVHLYRSADSGQSWSPLTTEFGGVTAVAVDPDKPGAIYAALDYGGLPQIVGSTDGGATWAHNDGYANIPFSAISLSIAGDGTLYAGLRSAGVMVSRDGGATFADFSAGLPGKSSTRMALHPQARQPYLAAVATLEGGGVFRAAAGGWQRSSQGLFAEDANGFAWTKDGALHLATDSGIFVSADGGGTWSATPFDGLALSLAADASDALYWTDGLALRRSSDGGRTWTTPGQVLDGSARLVATPGVAGDLYAYGQQLAHSTDGGATWTALTDSAGYAVFAADFSTKGLLYVWANDLRHTSTGSIVAVDPGLRVSSDGGKTWSASQSLGATGSAGIVAGQGRAFAALVTADQSGNVTGGKVVRSLDGGATWTAVLTKSEAILAIAQSGQAVMVALADGVLRSDDGGSTWKTIGAGNAAIDGLAAAPDGALYAATRKASLLRLTPQP